MGIWDVKISFHSPRLSPAQYSLFAESWHKTPLIYSLSLSIISLTFSLISFYHLSLSSLYVSHFLSHLGMSLSLSLSLSYMYVSLTIYLSYMYVSLLLSLSSLYISLTFSPSSLSHSFSSLYLTSLNHLCLSLSLSRSTYIISVSHHLSTSFKATQHATKYPKSQQCIASISGNKVAKSADA